MVISKYTSTTSANLLAVSLGSITPTPKFVFRYDLDMYYDETEMDEATKIQVCLSHVVDHAQHAVAMSKAGDQVGFFLSLPFSTDDIAVREALKPYIGYNVRSDYFATDFSFVVRSQVSPQAQI